MSDTLQKEIVSSLAWIWSGKAGIEPPSWFGNKPCFTIKLSPHFFKVVDKADASEDDNGIFFIFVIGSSYGFFFVLELRRLVLLDAVGKNAESRVIGFCLREIHKIDKSVEMIVSYADPKYGHDGTIYKASNFKYVGMSGKDKGYLDTETGKTYHSRALRTKYKGDFKPFVKVLKSKLQQGILIPVELPAKYCFIFRWPKK